MALAGLFLVTFLCVHLGINLLLLRSDGGQAFSEAAAFMGTNPFIRFFEIVLFAGFLLHIACGVLVSLQNKGSRPVSYAIPNKTNTSFLSKYMFHSGIVVVVFLALHFADYYLVKVGLVASPEGIAPHDFYAITVHLFSSFWYSLVYIVCFIFLGFHLNHAIQSAFQTMGWNHGKYFAGVKLFSRVYSFIIALGFSSIPAYFVFFK